MYHVTSVPVTISVVTIWHVVTGGWDRASTPVRVNVSDVSSGPPLEVVRVSPSAGYIQTPGWVGYHSLHPKNMDSEVRVDVPENHTAMITVLHLNQTNTRLAFGDTSKVTLGVYVVRATSTVVPNASRLLSRKFLPAGEDVRVHFQSGQSQGAGFKMFFSVSESSASLQKVSDDLWNCSGPNFAEFQPHFPCDLFPQCVDKEDERDCPYFSEDCGPGFVTLDTHCLVYEKDFRAASWRDMEFECVKRGGRLANLRTRADHRRLMEYLVPLVAVLTYAKIAVGLHSPSTTLPKMYRHEVQHTDDTIAFYRLAYVRTRVRVFCASVLFSFQLGLAGLTRLSLQFCAKRYNKMNALCEFPKRPADITAFAESVVPLRPVSRNNGSDLPLLGCRPGHVTRDFLACDFWSTCWSRDLESCAAPLTPLPPSFVCTNGFESVPYTLVCDFRPDCSDGSDESFCEFPPCDLPTPFYCSDRECVPQSRVCDGQTDCYKAEDEDLCSQLDATFDDRPLPPALVQLTRRGQFVVSKMDPSQLADISPAVCPETHFQCPGNGYCMPVFLRCNGVYDCLGREDEADCNSYTCPGFYRCRGSQVCLHPQHLCDGIFQCPQNDDELLCDLSCPQNCTCYGLAFYCRQPFHARNFTELRFLDGRGSGMKVSDLKDNVMLVYLSLAANGLLIFDGVIFPNLRGLDLSDNRLTVIDLQDFSGLPQVESLTLSGNPVLSLFDGVRAMLHAHSTHNISGMATASSADISHRNDTLPPLRTLNVSRVKLRVVDTTFLSLLPNLHTVNMSGGGVDTLLGEGFQALTQLRVLDLRHSPLTNFPRDMFRGLQELEIVYSDNYKLCCSATLPVGFISKNCHAPSDGISSCEALLRSNSYRVFLSVFASFALLGNASSFVFRVLMQNRKRLLGFDVFVAHLCVADFWMGVYLAVIGVADRLYQGTYLWEDNTWKASTVCHMAGFLSLVSSEVSALVICLITIDRFLVIRFPFSTFHFEARSAQVASLCVWGLGCLTAAVPLLTGVAHWQFYSQTDICIPLPVGRSNAPGYDYAFGVMIMANFVYFLVIAAGQFFIYWSVQTNLVSSTETTKKTQDLTIARRLITVAMSDFLCWFPIGLAGILAATGTPVSSEVNVALAIFVLPFNSALNPFLYTLNIVLEKRRKINETRIKERLMEKFLRIDIEDKIVDSC